MYLYIHQLFFPNLPFYNGKKIILSATKFYQCSKALAQGKLNQSLEALRLTTWKTFHSFKSKYLIQKKILSDALNKQDYWTLILQHKHNNG